MNKKKIMLVFGTRPEAIKMAPLYHAFSQMPDYFETKVCVTAQHRQMLDQVLNVFRIKPDIDLNIMTPGQDLFDVTSSVLLGMREAIQENKPDVLLVHGDTTTTFASSLAAFYNGIDVGHVEAGLRTYNLKAPFPEELNRQLTSKVTKWHFAPTEQSMKNLLNEGIPEKDIFVTGNTVIDSLYWVLRNLEEDTQRMSSIIKKISNILSIDIHDTKYVLVTGHRRENFGKGFINICNSLEQLSKKYNNINFIYPVHLNPNVREPVEASLLSCKNIHLIEPLEYEPFIYLLKNSYMVLTDSGGIQEEAPSLGKPVLVMRDVTERPEAIEAGTVGLVGAHKDRIIEGVTTLIEDRKLYDRMSKSKNPFGDGNSCQKIREVFLT